MPLGTLVAGAYTATLSATAIGLTENGFKLRVEPRKQAIRQSDVYAKMLIDSVFQGLDYSISYVSIEYKAGATAPAFPYGAIGVVGVIGRLDSNIAAPLVLTATTGTPAAAAPATLTANLAILAEGSPVEINYTSELRTFGVTLTLYAYDSGGGVIKHIVQT